MGCVSFIFFFFSLKKNNFCFKSIHTKDERSSLDDFKIQELFMHKIKSQESQTLMQEYQIQFFLTILCEFGFLESDTRKNFAIN